MAKKEDDRGHDSEKTTRGSVVIHATPPVTKESDPVAAAVLAEREACAAVADEIAKINPYAAAVAEAIRARTTT